MAATTRARTALLTLTGGAIALYGLQRAIAKKRPAIVTKRELSIARSQIIQAPKEEVYARWARYEDLPRIMKHVVEVEILDDKRQRWKADLLAHGAELEWIAEVVDEVPGQRIAWRAIEGAPVRMDGEVRFTDVQGGEATRVDVEMSYGLPTSRVAALAGRALKPALQEEVRADLRRFQAELEAGEIPTTYGQSAGANRKHGITLVDKIGGAT
jgi:uncharacterized membrane protein